MKRCLLAMMLMLIFASGAEPVTEEVRVALNPAVVVLLPRRVDYDVLVRAALGRVEQLEDHRYWQGAYLATGALCAVGLYKLSTSGASSGTSGGSGQASTAKPVMGFFQKFFHDWKNHLAFGLAFVLAQEMLVSGSGLVSSAKRLWSVPNNVQLYECLSFASLNSFNGLIMRMPQGFLITDADVIKRYNGLIISIERYVIELIAQTIYRAKKRDVTVKAMIDPLIMQLVRDIDDVNISIMNATKPFAGEQAKAERLLNFALETLEHMEALYDGLFESDEQQHSQRLRS